MEEERNKVWERILILWGLITWAIDFITDAITVMEYQVNQSPTVATLATISMALASFVGFIYLVLIIVVLTHGKPHDYKPLVITKCIEAIVESIPQICINLYLLSSCGHNVPTIQYISAFASFVGASKGIINFDKMLAKSKKKKKERVETDQDAAGDSESEVNKRKAYDWLEILLLIITKGLAVIAKVLILVYYAFYLGWWTAMAIFYRLFIFFPVSIIIFKDDETTCCKLVTVATILLLLFVFWFTFVWSGDASLGIWSTFPLALFYAIENIVLLEIAKPLRIYRDPFCLYDDILAVHIGINVASVVASLIYTWKRRRKNKRCESLTEEIGGIGKKFRNKIVSCVTSRAKVEPEQQGPDTKAIETISGTSTISM